MTMSWDEYYMTIAMAVRKRANCTGRPFYVRAQSKRGARSKRCGQTRAGDCTQRFRADQFGT